MFLPQISKAGVKVEFLNSLLNGQIHLPHTDKLPDLPQPVRRVFAKALITNYLHFLVAFKGPMSEILWLYVLL